MGVIFVTHDLGVAGEIADRVAVMYAGRFVEEGPVGALMRRPLHPYAQGLLGATVHAELRGQRLTTIPGAPPEPASASPPAAPSPRAAPSPSRRACPRCPRCAASAPAVPRAACAASCPAAERCRAPSTPRAGSGPA